MHRPRVSVPCQRGNFWLQRYYTENVWWKRGLPGSHCIVLFTIFPFYNLPLVLILLLCDFRNWTKVQPQEYRGLNVSPTLCRNLRHVMREKRFQWAWGNSIFRLKHTHLNQNMDFRNTSGTLLQSYRMLKGGCITLSLQLCPPHSKTDVNVIHKYIHISISLISHCLRKGAGMESLRHRTDKRKSKCLKKKRRKKETINTSSYLVRLQTTECCGGALPALVILQAAVQTTAVVRLIQSVCVLQTHHLSCEDLQRFTELPRPLKHEQVQVQHATFGHHWQLIHPSSSTTLYP